MNRIKNSKSKKLARESRVRAKIHGTEKRPRLSVARSNNFIYAQLINDAKGVTLASVSSRTMKTTGKTKVEEAALVGEALGKKAKELGIASAIFDRGSYRYHGRVKALADAARKAGLTI